MSTIMKNLLTTYSLLFRYYGLMMWFPELFHRFDEFSRSHNGLEEASVCQVRNMRRETKSRFTGPAWLNWSL